MTNFTVGDLVGLRDGPGWRGTVLDVVESRPRWLLVYWHTPSTLSLNPLLESEDLLAVADERSVEPAGRAA